MGDTGPSAPPSFPQNSPASGPHHVKGPRANTLTSALPSDHSRERVSHLDPCLLPWSCGGLGGKDRIGAKALKLSVCWEALGGRGGQGAWRKRPG